MCIKVARKKLLRFPFFPPTSVPTCGSQGLLDALRRVGGAGGSGEASSKIYFPKFPGLGQEWRIFLLARVNEQFSEKILSLVETSVYWHRISYYSTDVYPSLEVGAPGSCPGDLPINAVLVVVPTTSKCLSYHQWRIWINLKNEVTITYFRVQTYNKCLLCKGHIPNMTAPTLTHNCPCISPQYIICQYLEISNNKFTAKHA